MSIGERISALRKERCMSQGQLADALDVSRQAVSKWENDQTSPDTLKLIKLAEVLDTEVEYLATGRKPVYEQPPIILNMVKKEDKIVEKVVEKPVIKHGWFVSDIAAIPWNSLLLGSYAFFLDLRWDSCCKLPPLFLSTVRYVHLFQNLEGIRCCV